MATARQFEDLNVWQEARRLVDFIYESTKRQAFHKDFGLREQIRRAAVSTMSNVAEGFERGTRREFIQFLNIAKGSNGEVRSQLQVAFDQKYISENEFNVLRDAAIILSRKLSAFIHYLEDYPGDSRQKKSARRVPVNIQPSTFNLQPR